MRHSLLVLALAGSFASGGPGAAGAVDFARRAPEFPQRAYTCRLDGADVALGERRCLRTPQGVRLATCGIVLNMSSWQPGEGSCP